MSGPLRQLPSKTNAVHNGGRGDYRGLWRAYVEREATKEGRGDWRERRGKQVELVSVAVLKKNTGPRGKNGGLKARGLLSINHLLSTFEEKVSSLFKLADVK